MRELFGEDKLEDDSGVGEDEEEGDNIVDFMRR